MDRENEREETAALSRRGVVGGAVAGGVMSFMPWGSARAAEKAADAVAKGATPADRVFTGEAWQDFCAQLAEAGKAILRPEPSNTPLDRAEGYRYLTRLIRVGLIQNLEAADPDFPFFYRPCDEYTKYGGDNPDNVYWSAMINGANDYKITATRGSIYYFSIGAKAFLMETKGTIESTGELTGSDLKVGPDGKYEIIVSSRKHEGNWLRTTPEANFLLIRQTYLDKTKEVPGTFKIERIGGPSAPAPLDPAFLATALQRTGQFVLGNANKWVDWMAGIAKPKNQMLTRDQDFFWKSGGDPLINYLFGYYEIQPDEAWVVTVTPPDGIFWNYSLYNWWNESFDYEHRPVTVNNYTAKRNADGTVTFVVAARDPGVGGNWLDTAGHNTGFALLRSYAAKNQAKHKSKVVKIAALEKQKKI